MKFSRSRRVDGAGWYDDRGSRGKRRRRRSPSSRTISARNCVSLRQGVYNEKMSFARTLLHFVLLKAS